MKTKIIKCRCPECCQTFNHRVPHDEDEAVIKLAQSFERCDTCKDFAQWTSKPQEEDEIDIEIKQQNSTLLDWRRIKKNQWMLVRDLLDVIQDTPEHFSRLSLFRAWESDGGDRPVGEGDGEIDEEYISVYWHFHPDETETESKARLDGLMRQLTDLVKP